MRWFVPAVVLLLAGCGDDDEVSCAKIEQAVDAYLEDNDMTEASFFDAIGARSADEAEAILAECNDA